MKWLSLIAKASIVIPVAQKLWYAVKKDVPRIPCSNCTNEKGQSTGRVYVSRKDADGEDTEVIITCPICKGEGKVRSTAVQGGSNEKKP